MTDQATDARLATDYWMPECLLVAIAEAVGVNLEPIPDWDTFDQKKAKARSGGGTKGKKKRSTNKRGSGKKVNE